MLQMDSNRDENYLQCPICLSSLVSPITLICGHTYCEPCIKNSLFKHVKNVCPICRQKILIQISYFSVNVALDRILCEKYGMEKNYQDRLVASKKMAYKKGQIWKSQIKKWIRQRVPWILIALLLYHLVRVKVNVFNLLFQRYKSKALGIAESIKKENSLDFKFLLFSQFMRILFSNMIIP